MAQRKRKIIMSGNDWGMYNISTGTHVRLQLIRLYLWLLRWGRRIRRGYNYCKYAAVVIPFWAAFVLIVYVWGMSIDAGYELGDAFWDLKSSLFTSVVLALITSFLSQYRKNKNSLDEQNRIYINLMGYCSQLYKDLMCLLCNDKSKDAVPFWPFYTKKMRATIHGEFQNVQSINRNSKEYKCAIHSISILRREFNMLAQLWNSGTIAESDRLTVNNLIAACRGGLDNLERRLVTEDNYPHWDNALSFLAGSLFDLIDFIRLPWRRDQKLKIMALKMIYEEDKIIAATFYNSAFLDVVDYDFYANIDDYIRELRRQVLSSKKIKVRVREKSKVS